MHDTHVILYTTRGNFKEILELVASHDEIVKEKLTCRPRNAIYTSPIIQNELLHIMSEMVQSTICCKIREAGLFSILVDETKDISKKEQITFVLRCIDRKEAAIHEYFLTFVEATSLDAKSLTQYIVDTIKKHQLHLTCIVSQGYDGASVMSGHCSGVHRLELKTYDKQRRVTVCYQKCYSIRYKDGQTVQTTYLKPLSHTITGKIS